MKQPFFHPICVDLDGTLIETDATMHAWCALARSNLFLFVRSLFWLRKGRAHFKDRLGKQGRFEAAELPYRASVLEWISNQKAKGHKIILATGSNERIAHSVAKHLGIFDQVLASDHRTNLKGKNKAKILVATFGDGNFDYIGDHTLDLHVWKHAHRAIVVAGNVSLERKVRELRPLVETLSS